MAIAHVQNTAQSVDITYVNDVVLSAFGSSVTSGNLIVVSVGCNHGSVVSISDTEGNTYIKAVQGTNFDGSDAEIWYAYDVTGGSSFTITITFTLTFGVAFYGAVATEFSGVESGSDPLDVYSSGVGDFTTSQSAGTPSTTENDTVIVAYWQDTISGTYTYTYPTSYTSNIEYNAGSNRSCAGGWRIYSSTNSSELILTTSSNGSRFSGAAAAFVAASGGGGGAIAHMATTGGWVF